MGRNFMIFIAEAMQNLTLFFWLGLLLLLAALCVWHVIRQGICNRLWLLPSHPNSKLLTLNAFSLGLLSIVANPANDNTQPTTTHSSWSSVVTEYFMLGQTVLICAVIGAFMPSIAASSTDLSNMLNNVRGVAVLAISVILTIFWGLFYPLSDDEDSTFIQTLRLQHGLVMVILLSLLLVLVVQAMAIRAVMEDVKAIVSQQLEQLYRYRKPGYKAASYIMMVEDPEYVKWSWEVVEHNTCIKLMMVLTSKPENVVSRSPSSAIVGVLVLFGSVIFFFMAPMQLHIIYNEPLSSIYRGLFFGLIWYSPPSVLMELSRTAMIYYGPPIVVCVLITAWRWVRVSLRKDDPPFMSLLMDAEPSYWRSDVNNFKCKLRAGPREPPSAGWRYGVKAVLRDTTDCLMFLCLVPLHFGLVFIIRFTHILSILVVQKLLRNTLKALSGSIQNLLRKPLKALISYCRYILLEYWPSRNRSRSGELNLDFMTTSSKQPLGVVSLEGEHVENVRHEFASAAKRIIRVQRKRAAKTKPDLESLLTLLRLVSTNPSSVKGSGIADVLDPQGALHVDNLHVEHGYQYGWYLTAISLLVVMTKIEKEVLGVSNKSTEAMNAIWQARQMVKVVEEQYESCIVCSRETYASACVAERSKYHSELRRCSWLLERRSSGLKVEQDGVAQIGQLLNEMLELTKPVLTDYFKKLAKAKPSSDGGYVNAQWPKEVVVAYTKHTICSNLLRWSTWDSVAAGGGGGGGGGGNKINKMLEYIKCLVAEVLASCLANLPSALDQRMTEAVHHHRVSKIAKGLFLIGQAKHVWAELQWPTGLHGHPQCTSLGQLFQYNSSQHA